MMLLSDIYLPEQLERYTAGLQPTDHSSLYGFMIAWTLFESKALDCYGSVNSIQEFVNNKTDEKIPVDFFTHELDYFKRRYIDQGNAKTNAKFEKLRINNSAHKGLVSGVLLGVVDDPSQKLIACLIIVYRYRNNLFHGEKWTYEMHSQQDNFNHATQLLVKLLNSFT
ncbi:hypothetical protein E0X81_10485 [Halomonas sp. GDM18]|nr:hypothetical protein E0X81_10485 [Halomonas sp. GDM18]